MSDVKKPMKGLYRDDPETPEGKYLIKRRDGTVPEWPSFVLGAADPMAEAALRAYSRAAYLILDEHPAQAEVLGLTREFAERIRVLANEFADWRAAHGQGDPGMGRHRKDDPVTVEEMKKGQSA